MSNGLDERSATDLQRTKSLVDARRRATALLAAVTALFVATFAMGDATWVGYLRSTAEAAMIGGVADWFAVVALFRHPLGLPIPHTAVIPRSKEGLGGNLAEFVETNFLDGDQLAMRLTDADLATRAGRWLVQPGNATRASEQLAELLVTVLEDLDGEVVADELEGLALHGLRTLPLSDLAGQGLQAAIAAGQHQEVLTAAIRGIRQSVIDNDDLFRQRLHRESPWWVPEAIDDAIFARASEALTRFLDELANQPSHELRRTIDIRLTELAFRLRHDKDLADELTGRVTGLANNPQLRQWAKSTWAEISRSLTAAAGREGSGLRTRLAARLSEFGERLIRDPELRQRVDNWVVAVAPAVAAASRQEISSLIASTVQRWDPQDTSHRLELWLGRDLQFVRINGTLVGGLVGLTIHTVVTLLGAA